MGAIIDRIRRREARRQLRAAALAAGPIDASSWAEIWKHPKRDGEGYELAAEVQRKALIAEIRSASSQQDALSLTSFEGVPDPHLRRGR